MRFAPSVTAFTLAAGLVGFSTLHGQPPTGKDKTADPDLAAIQGEWTITKLDLPGDRPAPPADYLKRIGVSVKGDIVTLQPPAEGDRPERPAHLRLVLDSKKTPRQADVTPLDDKGQVRRRIVYSTAKGGTAADYGPMLPVPAIYKVDSGTLVVCAPLGEEDTRPVAFKAAPPHNPNAFRSNDRGYALVELVRKK